MALSKVIRQRDGVITTYHRILFLDLAVNSHNSIAVVSYVNEQSREDDKNAAEFRPYRASITYETAYDQNMTVETAYDYLKTLPEFEGAEDI